MRAPIQNYLRLYSVEIIARIKLYIIWKPKPPPEEAAYCIIQMLAIPCQKVIIIWVEVNALFNDIQLMEHDSHVKLSHSYCVSRV